MKCPNRQTEDMGEAKLCADCGQSLLVDLVCSRCHHANKPTAFPNGRYVALDIT
jgi:hypothetical protein